MIKKSAKHFRGKGIRVLYFRNEKLQKDKSALKGFQKIKFAKYHWEWFILIFIIFVQTMRFAALSNQVFYKTGGTSKLQTSTCVIN